ncbi:hypothetical protein R1sor_000275 [Riccia sorocarpa]|uniref:Uncharacterized protein n=1 Tax=Riccia sorocarpa TaxID=122646 RepID=A0ABD3GTG8_9MARC
MKVTSAESTSKIATALVNNANNEIARHRGRIQTLEVNLEAVRKEAEKNDELATILARKKGYVQKELESCQLTVAVKDKEIQALTAELQKAKEDADRSARDANDQFNKRGEIFAELQALKAKYEKPKGDDEDEEDEESSQGGGDTDTPPRKGKEDEEDPEAGGTSATPRGSPRRSASPPGNQPQGESTAHSGAAVVQHVVVVMEVAQRRPAPEPQVEEGPEGQEGVEENIAPEGFVPHQIEVSESSTGEEGNLHPVPASLRARQLSIAHGESAPQGTVGDSQVKSLQAVIEDPPTITRKEDAWWRK